MNSVQLCFLLCSKCGFNLVAIVLELIVIADRSRFDNLWCRNNVCLIYGMLHTEICHDMMRHLSTRTPQCLTAHNWKCQVKVKVKILYFPMIDHSVYPGFQWCPFINARLAIYRYYNISTRCFYPLLHFKWTYGTTTSTWVRLE